MSDYENLRRDFAARLMAGLVACGNRMATTPADEAEISVRRADALLTRLGVRETSTPRMSFVVERHYDHIGSAHYVRIGRDGGTWKFAVSQSPSGGGSWSEPYDTEAAMRLALFNDLG